MTRIQQERFASREEYLAQKDTYILTVKKMQAAKKDLIVLHPLPRVDEIEVALDDDPRAMYFKQAKYGMYVRMALIITMLNLDTHTTLLHGKTFPGAAARTPTASPVQRHISRKALFRWAILCWNASSATSAC